MVRQSRKYCDWESVPIVLNVKDACVLLGWSDATVKKYLRSGEIKARKTGKDWLIPKTSIKAFVEGDGND
jgi:excisionase family DNA binding protein